MLFNFYNIQIYLSKLKKLTQTLTGYDITEISNAATASGLLLIFIKILYYFAQGIQLEIINNVMLLLVLFIICITWQIHFYFRFATFFIIKKALGDWFFGVHNDTWETAYKNCINSEIYIEKYQKEEGKIESWPQETWINKINIEIATRLIQLRLLIMSEPYLFLVIKLLLFYWLIFNKFLLLTYILSLFIIISRILLLYQNNDINNFMIDIRKVYKFNNKKIETIKPTYRNAFFVLIQ